MEIKELEQVLGNNFDLKTLDNDLSEESEYLKYVQKVLSEKIKFFIRTDLDKLLQILYRIDLAQGITDKAFELGEINAISNELAHAIIVRQLKKIDYSRKFYKKD